MTITRLLLVIVASQAVASEQLVTARKRSLRRLCFYRCLSVHRGGGVVAGGRVWLLPGVGMRGCSWGHAWLLGGHAWLLLGGACVVARGGHSWLLPGGHAWFFR